MPCTLKLVILYDARANAYTICGHNLSAEQAKMQAADWQAKSLNALVVDQRSEHRNPDPQSCRACRRTVVHSSGLSPKPRFQRRKSE